jgi:predicted AlkP superfamily phosphohydrolase/phosphomutase
MKQGRKVLVIGLDCAAPELVFEQWRDELPNCKRLPAESEALRDELKARFEAIEDPNGINIGTKVFKPQEVYRQCNGVPPDLIVYFGDLFWRSVGTVGYDSIYTFENDTGPDDCNHAQYGIVIRYDPDAQEKPGGRELSGLQLMDMAPTILQQLDVALPTDMQGRVF